MAMSGLSMTPALAYVWATMPYLPPARGGGESAPPAKALGGADADAAAAASSPTDGALALVARAFADQAAAARYLAGTARVALLAVLYVLINFVSVGVADLALYWGEEKFAWGTRAALEFNSVTILCGVAGTFAATAACFPLMGYMPAVCLYCVIGAGAAVGAAVAPSSAAVIGLSGLLTAATTAYVGVRTELTPTVAHASQGQMQGLISMLAQIASISAIYAYLRLFDATTSTSAPGSYEFGSLFFFSGGVFVLAAACAIAAGDSEVRHHAMHVAAR